MENFNMKWIIWLVLVVIFEQDIDIILIVWKLGVSRSKMADLICKGEVWFAKDYL